MRHNRAPRGVIRLGAAAGLALAVVAAQLPGLQAAQAASPEETKRAEELAREGVERLLQALEALVDSIPQYEMPEVTEEGDIIIRRKRIRPHREDPEGDEPTIEDTKV